MSGDYDWAGTPEDLERVRRAFATSVAFEVTPAITAQILEQQQTLEVES
jgi:hypothetical protein